MFINKNADLLIAMLPEGATVSGTATGIPNTLLKAFYTKTERAKAAKTGSKAGLAIQQKKAINKKRKEAFAKYSNSPKKQKDVERFKKVVKPLEAEVKTLDKDLEILNNELIGIATEAKLQRREIAKKMMGKDVHLEILEIIKEAGVSLKEGAEGVKMYYEIAKIAYQEGMMAANRNND